MIPPDPAPSAGGAEPAVPADARAAEDLGTHRTVLDVGIVTDEVSADLEDALDWCRAREIRRVELRGLSSGRIPHITAHERALLRHAVSDGDAIVTALSPGLFKHPAGDRHALRRELVEELPRTFELAAALDAPVVIVFGCRAEAPAASPGREEERLRVAELLHRAGDAAARAGCVLAVENESGFVCDSGTATAGVLALTECAALRVHWDPCNAFGAGEAPIPDGYTAVATLLSGVHVKDTIHGSHVSCLPVGDGVLDWAQQLRLLAHDRTVTHVTIETHCQPLRTHSETNVRRVRALIAGAAHPSQPRS